MSKTISWKHGTFKAWFAGYEQGSVEMTGWISSDGLWGIDERRDEYHITHLPTGAEPNKAFKTLGQARVVCAALSQRPGLWGAKNCEFGKAPNWSDKQKKIRAAHFNECLRAASC